MSYKYHIDLLSADC